MQSSRDKYIYRTKNVRWCRIKCSLPIQATLLVTAVLNRAAVGASSMSGGKLFQSLTVLGKKLFL